MTDTPDRRIGGLAPRPGGNSLDLSRLQRRNRPTVPQPAPTVGEVEEEEEATVTPLPRTAPVARKKPAAATPPPATAPAPEPESAGGPQDRITVYLDRELRGRARTAYRATAHLEGDRTWSDFIERAILAEVERRERAHNGERAYSASVDKLAPGRNVS